METVWSSLVNRQSSWKILQLTPELHNVYFLLQTKTTHVDSEMINITKFDIVTLCATLSEENNVFENNIYLHFVYTIEDFLKQLVTGHPVFVSDYLHSFLLILHPSHWNYYRPWQGVLSKNCKNWFLLRLLWHIHFLVALVWFLLSIVTKIIFIIFIGSDLTISILNNLTPNNIGFHFTSEETLTDNFLLPALEPTEVFSFFFWSAVASKFLK